MFGRQMSESGQHLPNSNRPNHVRSRTTPDEISSKVDLQLDGPLTMNHELTAEIEHYIENMNWDRITIPAVREAMEDIISQYHQNGYLTPNQIATLKKTCT